MEIGERKWWHDKVVYEIYPKSFCDSNGDGIGDLGGIVTKLDYLAELGADILWICPCFKSPFVDQGYDISDYCLIDPVFGSNEEMELLLVEAGKRGMSVILDLVANHCSTEHRWFQEACLDPEGKYGKYFTIVDAEKETYPNNWRSYFGGPVWSTLPGWPGKKYLHVFHEKQPDLNWENAEVREEIFRIMQWWLDRGVRGFRVDAIMNIKKPNLFLNFAPDREDGLVEMETVIKHAKGIETFLGEMKEKVLDPYDAFTVAEICGEREEDLPVFIGPEGMFSSMFDFRETTIGLSEKGWYDRTAVTADQYRDACFGAQAVFNPHGFQTNAIENHDSPRAADRFLPREAVADAGKKMLAMLHFFMRGIPCIYQGQEIGMENISLQSLTELNDVSALGEYGYAIRAGLTQDEALQVVQRYSRDNARTPMQWSADEKCGFTEGKPWMRINPNHTTINVRCQKDDPDSVLACYKEIIRLRKSPAYHDTLVYGSFIPMYEGEHDLMVYRREGDTRILVAANWSNCARRVDIPACFSKVLMNNLGEFTSEKGEGIILQAYQCVVLEAAND